MGLEFQRLLSGFPPGQGPVSSGPAAANDPYASPPQLTVYLGKRDFVDHIDLVDPVGESLEGERRAGGTWGWPSLPEIALSSPEGLGAKNGGWMASCFRQQAFTEQLLSHSSEDCKKRLWEGLR